MKLSELKTKLCARVLYMPDPEREADGGYCGDFLSFVMQRAPENSRPKGKRTAVTAATF